VAVAEHQPEFAGLNVRGGVESLLQRLAEAAEHHVRAEVVATGNVLSDDEVRCVQLGALVAAHSTWRHLRRLDAVDVAKALGL
jgi:hypothetical protein